MSEQDDFNALASAIDELLDGQDLDCVVPILGVHAAKALVGLCDGDRDRLSTLLLRFVHLVENEATDLLAKSELLDRMQPDSATRQ